MEELLQQLVFAIQTFVMNNNMALSVMVGSLVIIMESIIPALPLSVFIALNMVAFGSFTGFIISWISTIIGCTISFFLFRKARKIVGKKLRKEPKIINFVGKIDKISFSSLFLILALPFTPAFSINIAAGVSKMKFEKYLIALLFSKLFIVYFWGYVGTTVINNITNIAVMIKLVIVVTTLFILSKVVAKKFNL